MDVGGWLRNLGFEKYEPTFVDNAIGGDVLPELTESDLEKLGIPLGDRKRLIKAISTLGAVPAPAVTPPDVRADGAGMQAVAERRHLTVMICDLVGSTALSARLDPEDMGAVIDAYHAACARITLSYEGFLADFRGDGIVAYFGYPRAHEDDAERTVRAALDIIAAVARLETRAGEPLSVRIGIATGLVVVGKGTLREHAVVGDPPNVAARLQGLVEPGTVVIAESTRRLVGDAFSLRDLGRHELKGIPESIAAWAVEGEAVSESRFEAFRSAHRIEIVDRVQELDFLLERQRLASKGEGQIVLISGEPGIGKSRLAAKLAECVAGARYAILRYQGSPYHTNSALRPIIAQLERAAGFKADDTPEQRLDKLEALIAAGGSPARAAVPLLAAMLSIPFGDRYQQPALSPIQQRRSTLTALLDHFESLARLRPILVLFEDVHWADSVTLELIALAVQRTPRLPVLLVLTFRPDFAPPWVGLPNVAMLNLGRLDGSYVATMVTQVAGGRTLPGEVLKEIISKTDGNPLFVEELTKAVLEGGILVEDTRGYRLEGPIPRLAIPETLQDSLMARFDRLVSAREVGQIGAAIGREFSYALVRAVVGRDETALKHALGELEQAQLVFRRGDPPDAVYSFKHALVRDAAYESLLKSRRQQLHGQIARALEKGFPDVVESQPEIVAHHLTEAGLLVPAIEYWLKAGNLALSRSANAEAVKHLRQALELTQAQPPSATRDRKEIDVCLALGPAISATDGYASPETLRVFSHARELLGEGGTLAERMTVLWGVYLAHAMRAEHLAAHDVAQQCATLAAQADHPGISALAHRFMGQTLWMMGAFGEARARLERTLHLCAANRESIASYRRFGADDEVTASGALSRTLWILGDPEKAVDLAAQALARARSLGRAFTTAFALDNEALLGVLGAEPERAAAHAREALAHSIEHSLADYEQRAQFLMGALLAQSGDPKQGIELMRNAIDAVERASNRSRRTLYLGYVAAAHASLGQPDVGLALLDEAIQAVETMNERFFEAELHRLRGDTLLMLGRKGEGEAALRNAITVAQLQNARWWELRAALSLAKHWREERKLREAHSILRPLCNRFADYSDAATLREAQALLHDLTHAGDA